MSKPLFRQHHHAPSDVHSPLYRQLTREWADLHAMASTRTTVTRWGHTEPALSGYTLPGDIIDAIDSAERATKDELLLALLRSFHDGSQLAGRTILQTLLPKLSRIAASAHLDSRDRSPEDQRHITIAEFWDVAATYPTTRRPRAVAANLALDTLHRITTLPRLTEIPVDPHEAFHDGTETTTRDNAQWTWTHTSTTDIHIDDIDLNNLDLNQVLAWGTTNAVITPDEANLLAEIYLGHTRTFTEAAQRLGISPAGVRQRCSRATRKLTTATTMALAA